MSDSLDITRRGPRASNESERTLVLNWMWDHHRGEEHRTNVEALARSVGMGGRTVRDILSAADGVVFLLGGDPDEGFYITGNASEAAAYTRRLQQTALSLLERVKRRDGKAERLPGYQRRLFP